MTVSDSFKAANADTLQHLSEQLEELLVSRNPRGMAQVRSVLPAGYVLRAAQLLCDAQGDVVICTGFPVANTFETDGPAGALALYQYCEQVGLRPWLLAGEPLVEALGTGVRAIALRTFERDVAEIEADRLMSDLDPSLLIVIERPGAAEDGRYYNIRGIDISDQCRPAEPYVESANCPVVAIGDGGNEIGMGNAGSALDRLDIKPAVIGCDELVVADVSNWGAYGLVAMTEHLRGIKPLDWFDPEPLMERLVEVGAVDGVTHQPTATEDGLELNECRHLLKDMQRLLLGNHA